ncbi:MAG TPA: competence protein CoiA family protein [Chlamydiales bacterium]|jgi:competence protein CoiA|nr:competence protein CoiA family protein [Chlamydiales bacterium]
MSLYAYEEEILVYAVEAEAKRTYRCAGCGGPVRARRGHSRIPHFYHLARSPSCRLYSKSEDHLLVQLFLQKMLPVGETVVEKPFAQIRRVADVAWENRKLVFEIQCSLLTRKEAEQRMQDYKAIGYQVVWLLDDRVFNRRILRPAEKQIRRTPCYYATIRKDPPLFYDQFEIFDRETRLKKGRLLKVRIDEPRTLPSFSWEEGRFPSQILQKTGQLYFQGDLIHRALLAETVPAFAFSFHNLCALERMSLRPEKRKPNLLKKVFTKLVLNPLGFLLLFLLKQGERQK